QNSLQQEFERAVSFLMDSPRKQSPLLAAKQFGKVASHSAKTQVPPLPPQFQTAAVAATAVHDDSLPAEFFFSADADGLRKGSQRELQAVGSLSALPMDDITRVAELYGFSSKHMKTTSSSTLEWDRMISQQPTRPPSDGSGGGGGATRPPAGAVPSARDGWFAQAVQNGQQEPPSNEISTAAAGNNALPTVVYTSSATSTSSNNGVSVTDYSNTITTNYQTIRVPADSAAPHNPPNPTQGIVAVAARPFPPARPPPPLRLQLPSIMVVAPPAPEDAAPPGMSNDRIGTPEQVVLTFPAPTSDNGSGSLLVPTAAAEAAAIATGMPRLWTRPSPLSMTGPTNTNTNIPTNTNTHTSQLQHSTPPLSPPNLSTSVLAPLATKSALELPQSWTHQKGVFGAAVASDNNIQTAAVGGISGGGRVATQSALLLRHVPGSLTATWGQPRPRTSCPHSSSCPEDGVAVSAHHLNDFLYDMDYVVPDDSLLKNPLFDPLYRVGVAP
ncbi:hypothetical protein Vafri_7051, partial [Volvox africanus]